MEFEQLIWFPMTDLPRDAKQLLVFDTRVQSYRCVSVRDDGFWQEESGKIYDPKFAPFYTKWALLILAELPETSSKSG